MLTRQDEQKRWRLLLKHEEEVIIFVIGDSITTLLLVIGLFVTDKILEFLLPEQHPFVTTMKQFSWIPFIMLYFYLILSDLIEFIRNRREGRK